MAIPLGLLNNKASITGTEKIPVSGSGNPSITPNLLRDFYIPFVTPEMFGAVGDGATNDAVAIQAAVDTLKPVFFQKKNYRITTAIILSDNAKIFGAGAGSIISVTTGISIFSITGNYVSIENMSFLGDLDANQFGISIQGNVGLTLERYGILIDKCIFISLNSGIYATNVLGTSGGLNRGGAQISNCIAISCTNGYFLDTRAEYFTLTGCGAYSCTTGFRMNGGNNNWTGGQLVTNGTGIIVGSGANDGHCVIAGAKLNHNTTNVNAASTANGYMFIGCMLYSGHITLTSAALIKFENCEFGGTITFTSTSCTNLKIENCEFVNTPTFSITGNVPLFINNRWIAALPTNVPITVVGNDRVLTTDATVTTLRTIAIPASHTVKIKAQIVARRTGGASGTAEDGAVYEIIGAYKNVAGTATIIGALDPSFTAEDQAAWDATFTVSSGNVLIRVTGASGNNITWNLNKFEVQICSV